MTDQLDSRGMRARPASALDTVGEREQQPSVIWITGYSASGKTTVGRNLEGRLRENGVRSVFLDGDDLRSIFAHRWGYSREDRVDLARVYFRLCNHLATQGITVVISAVAMYEDVRRWVKENVAGTVEVYLDVPEEERRERDRATKQIYGQLGAQGQLYDEPQSPDLRIANYGGVSAEDAADQIFAFIESATFTEVDHGRSEHWDNFYSEATPPEEPSTFAQLVATRLGDASSVLEVGCGNGRDASFFARGSTAKVTAVDVSEQAIAACQTRYALPNLSFIAGDIGAVPDDEETGSFDAVYSRFCLHAMTPVEEDQFIERAARLLRDNGRLFVECRSILDPLARKGEVISKTERIFGHYRRFIVVDDLIQKLNEAGFEITDLVEKAGLAKFGDDDPVVIRLEASR